MYSRFTLVLVFQQDFGRSGYSHLKTGPGHALLARRQGFMAPTLRVGIYDPYPSVGFYGPESLAREG